MIKVVFHIDETEKWGLALANVHNLLAGIDAKDAQIEVVVNGAAVEAFADLDDALKRKMHLESEKKVRISVCRNSLKSHGIDAAILPDFVEVVPVGVLELAERQHEGFAYIKP